MFSKILHIYGPLEINSFNAALLIGIGVFFYCVLRHPGRERFISRADFINISLESGLAGVIGSRILHIISQWDKYDSFVQMISIQNGGLSLLGAIGGCFFYSLWQGIRKGLPLLVNYDIVAVYAPLVHAIARIGCLGAGCCYGAPTAVSWGITYSDHDSLAPLGMRIHPSQLYSSLLFILLFIVLRWYVAPRTGTVLSKRPPSLQVGSVAFIYLMGMSAERFFVDFFRGDRIMVSTQSLTFLSFHQWLSLGVFAAAAIALFSIHSRSFKSVQAQRL